jgi:DNA-binding LacI/PurR family transcriptional regulator
VDGLLLLPVATPRALGDLLPWSEFSVVTTTYGVLAPEFHRVVPHQFGNSLQTCQRLAREGFRRVGLVLPAEQDLRVHHGFSAAVAWQSVLGGTDFIRPLIHNGPVPRADELGRWFKRERPDVIIAAGENICRSLAQMLQLPIPGQVGFVSAKQAIRFSPASTSNLAKSAPPRLNNWRG